FGVEDIALSGKSCRYYGRITLHQMRARIDVVVAVEHNIHAGLRQRRGKRLPEFLRPEIVHVIGLRKGRLVKSSYDPIFITTVLSHYVFDIRGMLVDVRGQRLVSVQ